MRRLSVCPVIPLSGVLTNETNIASYGVDIFAQFVNLFPDAPLGRMVTAYFAMIGTPLNEGSEEKANQAADVDIVGTIVVRFIKFICVRLLS
jgi:hypothetical protein